MPTIEAERLRAESCPSPAGAEFDDCAYWTYMEEVFTPFCTGVGSRVPDFRTFHLSLRALRERLDAVAEVPADAWRIAFKAEDDVPLCQVVGLIDFARFRDFDFDWASDAAVGPLWEALLAAPPADPFPAGEPHRDALVAEALFPIATFVP
jgi:hypothetical protein